MKSKHPSHIKKVQSDLNISPELRNLWLAYAKDRKQSDKEALLNRYAYLVRYVIDRMKISLIPTLDRDDLESVGSIGLIQSIEKYDLSRNIKFETYAYRRIQGSILDYIRQLDFLSRSSRERSNRVKKGIAALKEKFGRYPSDAEILRELKIEPRELRQAYFEMSCDEPVSLDSSSFSFEGDEFEPNQEAIWDSHDPGALSELIRKETLDRLKQSIHTLPEKERLLVALYYYEDLTFKEIGQVLHVSESRVCQIHSKALMDIQLDLEKKRRRP